MSNSRRGLLAAGLAAAVVGSMGVVWTLNADADELPASEAPAAVTASADPAGDADAAAPSAGETAPADESAPADMTAPADVTPSDDVEPPVAAPAAQGGEFPEPPKVLPWGQRPSKLKRARAGANSRAVAAAGADAAPADTSGSLEPVPEYAPKGRNSRGGLLRKARTTVVPPAPPTRGAAAAAGDVYFHYAVGTQVADTDGSWANLSIAKPYLARGDFHTLTEIAVQSADGRQIVEVGWTVDRAVNGDDDPHLFVYYWKDRVPSCYNACGFTMYSSTVKPGDTLPVGTSKRFGIQHFDGVWWIAYDSEWIGYFPDRLWNGTYTRAGLTQWFGEVASATDQPCTDMGNSLPAGDLSAARIGSISMTNGPVPFPAVRTTSPYYSVQSMTDRTFRFGGSGAC
ncbi:neprosin family prolyl endopeptidase [Couchioplanes caeruleus]|uniref:neprosin family prolyl endopeptidase n=1 Tax=Couchioplanes caeruleus TaxID=56438 RepID=UPI0020BF6D94|nr:neprosin family prolyl endopeptidase [Couchioplanes caeruleus]UQU64532.1 neprosin family prolyl endopeptidase [Couchioplanes caeruleus]